MIDNNKLNHFAELAIKVGVNLQKDQFLVVNCPVECAYIARIIVEQAYKAGAGQVFVNWRDDVLSRLNMQYASEDVLKDIPQWQNLVHLYLSMASSHFRRGKRPGSIRRSGRGKNQTRIHSLRSGSEEFSQRHDVQRFALVRSFRSDL